jgi:hypothetical protein
VPPGVPAAAPHVVAGEGDRTMRAEVLGVMGPDPSDGICEVSDDGSTKQVGNLGLTTMLEVGTDDDPTRR